MNRSNRQVNCSKGGGPIRAYCLVCEHRFPWPPGAPPTSIEPLIRPEVACPSCHRVGPLTEEPHDESWWAYITDSTEPEAATIPKPKKAAVPVIGGSIE